VHRVSIGRRRNYKESNGLMEKVERHRSQQKQGGVIKRKDLEGRTGPKREAEGSLVLWMNDGYRVSKGRS